jgi:hypothetical protein
MDNVIFILVTFGGKDLEFNAIVQRFGYTYRISLDVYNTLVYFESDEEGNYGALSVQAQTDAGLPPIDIGLLQAIARVLTWMSAHD